MLDRTYVKTEDTPYKDAFITEEGWNELSDIVRQLEEGVVRTTKTIAYNLDLAYRILIVEYLTTILESFGYDPETFTLDVNQIKPVKVEIRPDVCEEWKYRKKN